MKGRRALVDVALWVVSGVLFVLSFVLSWGPPPDLGPTFSGVDKVWHLAGYGALSGSLLLAVVWRPGRGDGPLPGTGLSVAALVVGVAWITEALQLWFGRDTDILDAVADLAGVALAFALWAALPRVMARRRRARR